MTLGLTKGQDNLPKGPKHAYSEKIMWKNQSIIISIF